MRCLALILTALLLAQPIAAEDSSPTTRTVEPSAVALEFVGQFSDDHLAGMLSRIGARSPVLAGFAQLDSVLTAQTFDAAIAAAVARNGPAWQRNMAIAWTGLMNDAEFASLVREGTKSPASAKYESLRADAGLAMQTLSQELFVKTMREVIDQTVVALTPEFETPPTE